MHEFIHEMNHEVLTPCQMMSVGESPAEKASDVHLLVSPDRAELDMIFTFEHMHIDRKQSDINGRWALQNRDLVSLKRILSNWQLALRDNGWNALYFENHDRARVISRWEMTQLTAMKPQLPLLRYCTDYKVHLIFIRVRKSEWSIPIMSYQITMISNFWVTMNIMLSIKKLSHMMTSCELPIKLAEIMLEHQCSGLMKKMQDFLRAHHGLKLTHDFQR